MRLATAAMRLLHQQDKAKKACLGIQAYLHSSAFAEALCLLHILNHLVVDGLELGFDVAFFEQPNHVEQQEGVLLCKPASQASIHVRISYHCGGKTSIK
jgi:hypothetical protein